MKGEFVVRFRGDRHDFVAHLTAHPLMKELFPIPAEDS